MPSVDLPNNGNVWQTTEPVKGRPTMYQQVISIIGKLNHRILPAPPPPPPHPPPPLFLSRYLCFLLSNFKVQNCRLLRRFTHHPRVQSARRTTSACLYSTYSYTISYARLLSKLTPSYVYLNLQKSTYQHCCHNCLEHNIAST